MRLLLTRPRDDSERLAETLAARGIETIIAPIIDIAHRPDATVDVDNIQAFLITSANGARALAAATSCRDRPVYAVGAASALAAQAAGFNEVTAAEGDVDKLADLVAARLDPAAGPLLHAAGRQVAGDLSALLAKAGFTVRREVLYEAVTASSLPEAAQAALREGTVGGAVFFSPRTGAAFARLVQMSDLGDSCTYMTAYCLSMAVAEAVGPLDWGAVEVAEVPTQEALLALVGNME